MTGADIERRSFEFRAVQVDGSELPVLEGIAVPYNSRATIGPFTESFRQGGITAKDVVVNVQHDMRQVVARTGGGLTLADTPEGLRARIELPDTSAGRDAGTLVKNGVLRGLSVEFRAIRETWEGTHRIVQEAVVNGLAIVTRPAYAEATVVEGRSVEAETILRNRKITGRRVWRSL